MALGSLLPQISISPAPTDVEHKAEPYSPFSSTFTAVKENPDAYRPVLLSLPPSPVTGKQLQLSPLRPVETVTEGTGMQRERFEALLRASRDRQAAIPAKKDNGLLREIALKAHKNKQVERRALFLSKVLAPPSPTATCTPKTPPESPAIFHYSLPSPGLTSPLSLFESLEAQESSVVKECWVEQVDFKLPSKPTQRQSVNKAAPVTTTTARAARQLPSLAQISAHLHNGRTTTPALENRGNTRLPAFLNAPRRLPTPPGEPAPVPRLAANVGRLTLPIRAPQPTKPQGNTNMLPPPTPTSPLTPKLQVTTVLVPRIVANKSPTQLTLTETNVQSLSSSREQRAKTMLSAIRKRQPAASEVAVLSAEEEFHKRAATLSKRKSAPGDLTAARRQIWGSVPAPGAF